MYLVEYSLNIQRSVTMPFPQQSFRPGEAGLKIPLLYKAQIIQQLYYYITYTENKLTFDLRHISLCCILFVEVKNSRRDKK